VAEVPWTRTRSRSRTLAIHGAIIAVHAVLLMSSRRHSALAPIEATGARETRVVMLMAPPLRAAPLASLKPRPEKPPQALPETAPAAMAAAVPHAAPVEAAAAQDDMTATGTSAGIDENWTAQPPATSTSAADIRTYSLRLAGKADAEVRQGKPAPLDPPDTPFRRMQDRMAQAANGGGNGTTTSTSPSGETITLVKRGGKTHCYVPVSTSVTPSAVFDNRGSGRSTEVQCPKGVR
jgi:hypothetical protein